MKFWLATIGLFFCFVISPYGTAAVIAGTVAWSKYWPRLAVWYMQRKGL